MVSLVTAMQTDGYALPALVLSNVPTAGGLEKAKALGVTTAVVDHLSFGSDKAAFESAMHKELLRGEIDLVCLAGFMRVLSANFVAKWEGRILNIHPSLLPKYKGLDTHARALRAKDTEAGCSVHVVMPDLDAGPILGRARVPIYAQDTADMLAARVLKQEHLLYPQVLQRFLRGNDTLLELAT